ncbi:MAG: hypothetical protein AABX32_02515 [Nanoarchaeota archaeon]
MDSSPSKLTDIRELLETFKSILDSIYGKELTRLNWRDLMLNRSVQSPPQGDRNSRRGFLFSYHKKFAAFSKAVALSALISQDIQRFAQEKARIADEIENLDLELSKRVRYFAVPSEFEFAWLKRIAKMLDSDPALGADYIRTHYPEIMQRLAAFHDRKTEYQLKRLVVELSGEEITELNKCLADIERWAGYIIRQGPEFFALRLRMYLKGGMDEPNISGQRYLGLTGHFKDVDLANQMMEMPQARVIWTYPQQLTFLNDALYYAREAIKKASGFYKKESSIYRTNEDGSVDYRATGSRDRWNPSTLNTISVNQENGFEKIDAPSDYGGWSLFLGTEGKNYRDGFVYNLRKGKRYIAMVEETFGNHAFAEFLDKTERECHQSPTDWYKKLLEFRSTFRTLMNIRIDEARKVLTSLFNERKSHLYVARSSAENRLRGVLQSRIGELKNAEATAKKQFGKMLKKHWKRINSEWSKIKWRYESTEEGTLLHIFLFKERAEKLLEKMDRRKIFSRYRATLKANIKTGFFFEKALRRLASSPNDDTIFERLEIPMIYSLYKSYRQSVEIDESIEDMENVDGKDVAELISLISLANRVVIPSIGRLESEINRIVDQYFLQEAQQLLKSEPADSKDRERIAA